ncbi:hypothetical protein WH47_01157 [Habropoda laboriosa]|uniref:Uncharacterized protein n=1 Tax=Habropoda laboriosa TaxID=597456 RepID=A0A0L7QZ36_9HYME|nr:hypothetical protein WH47_01157 [Habropoda laboriosa]
MGNSRNLRETRALLASVVHQPAKRTSSSSYGLAKRKKKKRDEGRGFRARASCQRQTDRQTDRQVRLVERRKVKHVRFAAVRETTQQQKTRERQSGWLKRDG